MDLSANPRGKIGFLTTHYLEEKAISDSVIEIGHIQQSPAPV